MLRRETGKKQRDKNWFIRKIRIRFIRIRTIIEASKTCTKTAEDEDFYGLYLKAMGPETI